MIHICLWIACAILVVGGFVVPTVWRHQRNVDHSGTEYFKHLNELKQCVPLVRDATLVERMQASINFFERYMIEKTISKDEKNGDLTADYDSVEVSTVRYDAALNGALAGIQASRDAVIETVRRLKDHGATLNGDEAVEAILASLSNEKSATLKRGGYRETPLL